LNTESLYESAFQNIKQLYKQKVSLLAIAIGSYQKECIISHYVNYLVQCFPKLVNRSLTMVFDYSNGAIDVIIFDLINIKISKKMLKFFIQKLMTCTQIIMWILI